MEPIVAVLPQLDAIRREAIAAPKRRQGHLSALVLPLEVADTLFQDVPTLDRPRSGGRPRRPAGHREAASGNTGPTPRRSRVRRCPRCGSGAPGAASREPVRPAGSRRARDPCGSRGWCGKRSRRPRCHAGGLSGPRAAPRNPLSPVSSPPASGGRERAPHRATLLPARSDRRRALLRGGDRRRPRRNPNPPAIRRRCRSDESSSCKRGPIEVRVTDPHAPHAACPGEYFCGRMFTGRPRSFFGAQCPASSASRRWSSGSWDSATSSSAPKVIVSRAVGDDGVPCVTHSLPSDHPRQTKRDHTSRAMAMRRLLVIFTIGLTLAVAPCRRGQLASQRLRGQGLRQPGSWSRRGPALGYGCSHRRFQARQDPRHRPARGKPDGSPRLRRRASEHRELGHTGLQRALPHLQDQHRTVEGRYHRPRHQRQRCLARSDVARRSGGYLRDRRRGKALVASRAHSIRAWWVGLPGSLTP